MSKPVRATIEEARIAPIQPGRQSSLIMEHGSMELRYYAPRSADLQKPHDRDELYVVASGRGTFVVGLYERSSHSLPEDYPMLVRALANIALCYVPGEGA